MRRAWSRLRAMLRRVLDGRASTRGLSEDSAHSSTTTSNRKIRSGMTPEHARRARSSSWEAPNRSRSAFAKSRLEPAGKSSSGTSATRCAVSVRRVGSRAR